MLQGLYIFAWVFPSGNQPKKVSAGPMLLLLRDWYLQTGEAATFATKTSVAVTTSTSIAALLGSRQDGNNREEHQE